MLMNYWKKTQASALSKGRWSEWVGVDKLLDQTQASALSQGRWSEWVVVVARPVPQALRRRGASLIMAGQG